jgi:hypothetical protein
MQVKEIKNGRLSEQILHNKDIEKKSVNLNYWLLLFIYGRHLNTSPIFKCQEIQKKEPHLIFFLNKHDVLEAFYGSQLCFCFQATKLLTWWTP